MFVQTHTTAHVYKTLKTDVNTIYTNKENGFGYMLESNEFGSPRYLLGAPRTLDSVRKASAVWLQNNKSRYFILFVLLYIM